MTKQIKPSEWIGKEIDKEEFMSFNRGSDCGAHECECYANGQYTDALMDYLDRLAEKHPSFFDLEDDSDDWCTACDNGVIDDGLCLICEH